MTRNVSVLIAATALALLAGSASAQTYSIDWYTIDGGGHMFSSGGSFQLGGTIGQPDAGPNTPMTGGNFELVGGFWVVATAAPCGGFSPCDTNCNGTINQFDIDPFILIVNTHVGCSPCAGDTNSDGSVNSFDIFGFLDCLIP